MKLGMYRHYKWSLCEVIDIAKHSETLEDMVVYKHYDAVKGQGEMSLRVRPMSVFQEKVVVDGKELDRFTYIGE
jgi:cyclomaltodextrinase / maltogenic alpha-amylase / neopullulanase